MDEGTTPHGGGAQDWPRHRYGVIGLAIAVQVLLYLYLYVYIFERANPKGDGMEWVAVMPATYILVLGVVPALALHQVRRWPWLGVSCAIVGVILSIAYIFEIAREFAESAR